MELLFVCTSVNLSISATKIEQEYLEAFDALEPVSFDLSLARGLDYYTGVIYEVVTEGSAGQLVPTSVAGAAPPKPSKKPTKGGAEDEDRSNDPSVGVGSVAAGGRYDNLVGMFSGKNQIPCVGISFGVDRIFSITKARMVAQNSEAVRRTDTDVFVMAFGGKGFTGLVKERLQVISKLWDAGIKAELTYKVKPKLPAQFKAAEVNGTPFAIILGEDELKQGKVKIKEMGLREEHPEKDGILVDMDNMVVEVQKRLARRARVDEMITQADGLRVVGGVKGESEVSSSTTQVAPVKQEETAAPTIPAITSGSETNDVENIGAVPAS